MEDCELWRGSVPELADSSLCSTPETNASNKCKLYLGGGGTGRLLVVRVLPATLLSRWSLGELGIWLPCHPLLFSTR